MEMLTFSTEDGRLIEAAVYGELARTCKLMEDKAMHRSAKDFLKRKASRLKTLHKQLISARLYKI